MEATTTRPRLSTWAKAKRSFDQVDRAYREAAARFGLTAAGMQILLVLYSAGPLQAGQLAERVACPPTSFTPILDTLQNSGFVKRKKDPKDRRAIRVHLTQKALAIRDALLDAHWRIENRLSKGQ